jgi:hypothetical protein
MPVAWLAVLWIDITNRCGDEFDWLGHASILARQHLCLDVRPSQDQAVYCRWRVQAERHQGLNPVDVPLDSVEPLHLVVLEDDSWPLLEADAVDWIASRFPSESKLHSPARKRIGLLGRRRKGHPVDRMRSWLNMLIVSLRHDSADTDPAV